MSHSIADDFSSTAHASLAIINGLLWTGNKAHPWAQAVAARGERIVAVGSNDDVKQLIDSKTCVIDLHGRLALPGFIDSHTHFIEAGFHLLSVKITVEEAVRAYTSSAAYAEFGEKTKGSLEVGKVADLVVLSQNFFRIDPGEIQTTEVIHTIVGGRVV